MNTIDNKLVKYYLQTILEPIRYGENAVLSWFPASGMTTIVNDLFNDKKLLNQNLGNQYYQLDIKLFWGHIAIHKSFQALTNESGFADYNELKEHTHRQLRKGNELVYILNRIDDYPDTEKLSILKSFAKLSSINPRRVHVLFNTINKPWFIKAMDKNPELLALANRLIIVPIIKDKLLEEYIKTRANQYNYRITDVEIIKLIKIYGGILKLTKEYLRSKGDISILELKIKLIWDTVPKSYKEIIENNISQVVPKQKEMDFLDLERFGILDLQAFNIHKKILKINSDKIIKSLLTPEENEFYNYLINHRGELISKDLAISKLRPVKSSEVSLWAIDKAISRFRVKMLRSSIDPTLLKTVKGKGYIWEGS